MKRDVSHLLAALSVDELLALQVRLTEMVARRTQEQIAAVLNDFAARAGLGGGRAAATPGSGTRRGRKPGRKSLKGTTVPPKYRDPANADNTWTGRGVPPRWMQAYLDAGHSREEYLIADATAAPAKGTRTNKRGGKQKATRKAK